MRVSAYLWAVLKRKGREKKCVTSVTICQISKGARFKKEFIYKLETRYGTSFNLTLCRQETADRRVILLSVRWFKGNFGTAICLVMRKSKIYFRLLEQQWKLWEERLHISVMFFFFILIFRLVRGKVIKKKLCNTEAEFKHRKFIFRSNEAIRMAFGKNILSDAQSPSLVWIS